METSQIITSYNSLDEVNVEYNMKNDINLTGNIIAHSQLPSQRNLYIGEEMTTVFPFIFDATQILLPYL